jgi:predicted porin
MKKPLICLAALAAAGAASAQSSVTVFGVMDAAVSYYQANSKYVNTALNVLNPANPTLLVPHPDIRQSQTVLSSGNYSSSRLGFRGTEDLGGGLAASFWLEAGLANDTGGGLTPTGALAFNRRSTVSLSGVAGELRAGRDYTPTYWNDKFDPFGTAGAGASVISMLLGGSGTAGTINNLVANPNYVRASNSVGYFLPPNLGGVIGQVMYAFGENVKFSPGAFTPNTPNTARIGRYAGGRLGYAEGPVDVAIAYGSSIVGDDFFGGITKKLDTANLGGSYDFGPVMLFGEYSHVTLKNDHVFLPIFTPSGDARVNGYVLGATMPVGPSLIRFAYSHLEADIKNVALAAPGLNTPDPKTGKFALGYVYNLSKRTALYATAAYTKNKNGAAIPPALPPNGSIGFVSPTISNIQNGMPGYRADTGYGYDFGIRHAF